MDWKDSFRELAKVGKKAVKEAEEAKKQRISEFRKIDKLYRSRIEHVCFEFCRAFRYPLSSSHTEPEGRYFTVLKSSWGRDKDYYYSIEVVLYSSGVVVKGRHSGSRDNWEESHTISLNEFTEDRLAAILTMLYKKIHRM